jgi:hypothetical protein
MNNARVQLVVRIVVSIWLGLGCRSEPAASAPAKEKTAATTGKGAVEAFHSVLKPVWHTKEEDARLGLACTSAAELHALATRMRLEPPAQATPAFVPQAHVLEQATIELVKRCATQETSGLQRSLADVHEAFHVVSECAGE